jgi:hypothetical protein
MTEQSPNREHALALLEGAATDLAEQADVVLKQARRNTYVALGNVILAVFNLATIIFVAWTHK